MGLNLPASSENAEFHLEHQIHRTGSEALGRHTIDQPKPDGVDCMIELSDLELQVALPHFPGRARQIDAAARWRRPVSPRGG